MVVLHFTVHFGFSLCWVSPFWLKLHLARAFLSDILAWLSILAMSSRRGARAMEHHGATTGDLTQALSLISIPPATRSQSLIYLAHIAKIFYCLLCESMKNQPDDLPRAQFEDFSEAFHKSLFDLLYRFLLRPCWVGNIYQQLEFWRWLPRLVHKLTMTS